MTHPDSPTGADGFPGTPDTPGTAGTPASADTHPVEIASHFSAAHENAAGEASSTDSIVVGHDGSPGADAALELAIELAEKVDVPLLIVRSWTIDTAPHGALFADGYVHPFDEVSATVRERLLKEVARIVHRHPSVSVGYFVALGQPAETLLKLSVGARMLVVGSRGRGGFASLMLGSVSEQCVRHAACPVLISRPRPVK